MKCLACLLLSVRETDVQVLRGKQYLLLTSQDSLTLGEGAMSKKGLQVLLPNSMPCYVPLGGGMLISTQVEPG